MGSTSIQIKPLSGLAAAVSQLYQAPKNNIRGVSTSDWFGPLQPVQPIAPPGTEPRGWQYYPGQNLVYTPRAEEEWTASALRTLAKYDLVSVIIENVKDQVSRMPWTLRAKMRPGETEKQRSKRGQGDKNLVELGRFFERPDGENLWPDWVRPAIDDMLNIDAASFLFRKTVTGKLMQVRVIDGATITRYIDENGWTPLPPSPAYAQLWYGIPMVDLTTDQLLYAPRNVKSYKLYGTSPVEQAATWIKIGTERLKFQLGYYTDGVIPGAIQVVDPKIPANKISESQAYINSDLAGQTAKRSGGLRLIQGFADGGKDQIIFPKETLLSDPFDDLVIRCLCFAFGTSPQRLMRMMNRASAQANQDAAEKEGLLPWLSWLESVINRMLIKMGYPDYEFSFELDQDTDILKQAQADASDAKSAIRTINEIREDRGLDPIEQPEADELGVITMQGFVPLGAQLNDGSNAGNGDGSGAQGGNGAGASARGKGGKPGRANAQGRAKGQNQPAAKTTVKKNSKRVTLDPDHSSHETIQARESIRGALVHVFGQQKSKALAKVEELVKATQPKDELIDALWKSIVGNFMELPDEIDAAYEQAFGAGISKGLIDLDITDTKMISEVNAGARDWAQARAAELVGMKRVDGKLVPNPNAEWVISDTTRDELRSIITNAFEGETPRTDLIAAIQDAGAFSESRAEMIAQTEVAFAQVNGNYDVWKKTGLVTKMKWLLSDDHEVPDECDENEDAEIEFGKAFPSGDILPPAHPNCKCVILATGFREA